ncbi:MAG TPA: low molecular weight protein-tyrosine-phosphatase [Chthonomonadales bacterium]|nr:low molecular weight protein-tyrosine-phosphatase [Chthonomonadales bacterium]
MVRVLFVCLGNICRSPMAEGVFRAAVAAAGLDGQIAADSAGTGHWHLHKPPHPGTRAVLDAHGIAYDHRARLVTRDDLRQFDYIVAMDSDNLADLRALGSARGELSLLLEHAGDGAPKDVPDPYYTGRFDEVYDLVERGVAGLLRHIRTEHHL